MSPGIAGHPAVRLKADTTYDNVAVGIVDAYDTGTYDTGTYVVSALRRTVKYVGSALRRTEKTQWPP